MVRAKHPDERVRRNKDGYDENGFVLPKERRKSEPDIQLPDWDGEVRGPELRDHPEGYDWHPYTVEWWETWRRSPQAMYCIETDWESLFQGAVVHDRVMRGVSNTALAALTGELRKREGMFGAALEDRLRLNMSKSTPRKETSAEMEFEVQRAVNYFERVNQRLEEARNNATGRAP
jgi:hypothetical protein